MKVVGVTAQFSGIGRASDHAMRRRRSGAARLALAALAVVVVTASLGSVGAAAPPRSSVAGSLAQEELSAAVTVTASGAAGTNLTVSGFPLTFTTTNWDTAQSATVAAGDDADADNDTVTLTLTATGAAEYADLSTDVDVTITDDDTTTLSGLSLSGVVLWPAFDPETASYSATVSTGVSSAAVAATAAASGATVVVKLGGMVDADGTVALASGENTVTVEVTNGAFMRVYTVTVTRLATVVGLSGSAREALMTRFDFWENEDWDWYRANIPFVETPDARLDETYYYRWQLVTTHLRYGSPRVGYVATEFNDSPAYGGAFGAIVAPSGHQFYEMQWLRERRYVEDSIATYFRLHSSKPYAFTSWLAENAWSLHKVHRNDGFATGLLSELVKYYEHYEETQFNSRLGLFWSEPLVDAMENTVSTKRALRSFDGGDGYRPTLNSYMYANALAIAQIADMAGDTGLAARYRAKAAAIKTNMQNRLWDSGRNFFLHMYRNNEKDGITAETLIDDTGLHTGDKKGREQVGFIPWAFNLPEDQPGAGYEAAWQYFTDDDYFKAPYGPTTAEKSDHQYSVPGRCCHWSGRSWPFATTQSLKAMANVLQNYTQTQIDKDDYTEALNTYVDVHMRGKTTAADAERPYIAEANHPDTGSWAGHDRSNHSENYFHSGFVDLVITGLLGLQPQPGDTLVLKPLVPDTWDYFILDNLRYHGRDITVIWDRDGTKYSRGTGFQVFVGDTHVYHSATVPATATIDVGAPVAVARDTLMNFAVNNTGATYPQATASYSLSSDPAGEATNGKYFYTHVPTDRWSTWTSTEPQHTFSVDFGQNRTIHTVKLYLYSDGGGVQTPTSYTIQYWNGTAWTNVTETSRTPTTPTGNRANVVEFTQVSTSRIRAVLNHSGQIAVGMTEFEAWGPAVEIPDPVRGENLALNADGWKYPRIYPSFDKETLGTRAHDGRRTTSWSTRESRNGANEFLRVDFNTETTFDTVVVEFRDAADSVTLEYLSGGSWVAIPGVHMTPATPADTTTTTATFPAVTAREVRVNFTTAATLSPTTGFTTAPISVNELEIYDLSLTGLTIDHSTPTTTAGLEPAFDPATLQYSAAIPPTATQFTVTAQRSSTAGPDPTIEIWTPPTAGTEGAWTTDADGTIDFPTTNNTIRVRALVTTTDNTATKTYTIDVRRPSSDANLSALALSGMALSPAFDPATTSYSAVFGAGVTSTAVAAVTADAGATVVVKLGGVIDLDGTVALAAGANTVTVEVTAEDGTAMRVYTVTATRAAANDASLSGLSLSGITLSPAFDPATTSYSATTVHHSVSSTVVTANAAHDDATAVVKLGGVIDGDGTVALAAGANTVTVEVTAEDGTAMRVYTVTATRPADTTLSGLSLSGVVLWPAFDPETASYSATVSTGVSSAAVAATAAASGATVVVKLGGMVDADGTVALASGENTVTVEVTNGAFMRVYTVTVTRLATVVGLSGSAREALMTRFDFWDNEDWDWYRANIPFVETPDARLDETYYYRWQLVTKHLRYGSPRVGYVATEFNHEARAWAGSFGAITAPSGLQLSEMQWFRDRRYAEDYLRSFFVSKFARPHSYSTWLADNAWSLHKVHRNDGFSTGLLSELVKYYEHFEDLQFNSRLGLFWSAPIWDAMEHTVSTKRALRSFDGGEGYRPTLNSYMYANALAIAEIADMAGDTGLAARYRAKAAAIKTNMQNRLWDSGRNFFLHMYRNNEKDGITAETLIDDTGLHTGDKKGREQVGFIPWAFNLPEDQPGAGYEAAWQYFTDDDYFKAPYGPTTAEKSDHQYSVPGRCCHWSGRSWPFATTQSLKAMANVLQNYTQTQIDKDDYSEALNTYVDVHMRGRANNGGGETPFIAEANHPDTGSWAGHDRAAEGYPGASAHYFHSGFVDLVITGLLGLQPQSDNTLVLKPLVPDAWDYFILDNLRYHGRELTVVWDRDGTKYSRGTGLQIFVDGTLAYHSATVPTSAEVDVGAPVAVARGNLMNYAVNNIGARHPQASASNSFRDDPPSRATNGKYFYTPSPTDRWTSYNTTAAQDTFSVDFGQERPIHTVKLYLYDDNGGVRTPSSYTVQYWTGTQWADVTETSRSPMSPTASRANTVKFTQVSTSRVRTVLTRDNGRAVGMTEFEAWGPAVVIPDPVRGANLALNADGWKYPRIYPSYDYHLALVSLVNDGSQSTYWRTGGGGSGGSRNGDHEYLRVDFGEQKSYNVVKVNFREAPDSMSLQYLNAGTWTAIPGVRMTPATPTDNTTTEAKFPGITTEQVRVNFTTAATVNPNTGIPTNPISVRELEIYEESVGSVSFGAASYRVVEGDQVTVEVRLSAAPGREVVVPILARAGTGGAESSDYSGVPGAVTFEASATLGSFVFTAVDDLLEDANESVEVYFGELQPGVSEGTPAAATVRITDNDTAAITAADVTVAEGADAQLAVRLTVRPTASVTVAAPVTSGTDLTVSGFPLTFTTANWDTAQSVTVAAGEDENAVDDTATLTLTASGAIEYVGVSVDVEVTVTDNDTAAITAADVTVAEGADAQLAVRLTVRPTASVTVAAPVTSGTDLTVSGFPLTFTTANWDTAQSVTVAAGEDENAVDDTATLTLTASGAAEYVGVSVDVEVTVTDDDIVGLQALMTRFSFWENEDWDWYIDNIPLIETPDARLDETYYYRWQLVTTHLRYASPQVGYVATEFNDSPGYAGAFGAIVAPSGHQLYEMQWLRDRRFAEDYITFYLSQHSSKPYSYSTWMAENVWSLTKVHRNEEYAKELLSELVKYYEHYEEMQFNPALGLFWSVPVWDAMEHTISSRRALNSYHGGDGYRPTLNSYMYANALAIQNVATMAGESSLAAEYGRKATALKANMQNRLWDDDRNFFLHMYRLDERDGILAETLIDDAGPFTSDKKGREEIGFIPWAFNLPDDQTGAGYEAAWQFFDDPAYFQAPYGPRTAELSDHHYGLRRGCCHWSGQSWPYSTTQSLKALANVVQNYDQSEVDKSDYITALNTYVDVHMRGKNNGRGIRPYIAEAIHPDTGSWDGHDRRNHSENYFHSGYVDLVLSGLFGLQPQPDDTLVLKPLVPDAWDYFLLDNLRYHGHEITIIWDRDGTRYNRGSGFQVFVDETRVHNSDTVLDSATINVGAPVVTERDNLVNYAVNNTGGQYPEASATYSFREDPPSEATNGKYYYTDVPLDRWTTWQSSAREHTFSVDFGQNRPIHTVKLYIYDDGGGVQTPSSYQIQYWNGSSWADVQETSRNPATPTGNRANVVEFSQVSTSRVRAVLSRNAGIAVGMTEFEAWGPSQPVADPPASDNLALNADAWKYPRIYPSFAYINDAVFRAHDGNRNTFWSNRESRNGTNEFLRVDFGEEETFKTVEVNFRDAPTSMNLEYLNNGSWTAIPDVRMTPATPADNTTTTATFPAITTEQIRINLTTTGTTQSNGFISNDAIISIREIEIYEDGPGVTVVGDDLTVYEGGDETYTVVLTSQPTGDVTVAINDPTDHGDVTASPASLTFTSSNWNREQGVTVTASPDDDTLDEEAMVTHTVSSTDAHYNAQAVEDVTVTVIDSNLRARFEQVPTRHDGSSEFRFQLHFSEDVSLRHTDFSGTLFETTGGTVTGARRLNPPHSDSGLQNNSSWEVVATPDGSGDMVITLPAGRGCDTDGAVCSRNEDRLGATVAATIAGPGPYVTARFEQVPSSHDGSTELRFQLHFSENVRLNHTDFSGALFETAGGTVTGARRLAPSTNIGWEVVARPDGTDDMVITLPAGRDCNTDGAVCTSDRSWLGATVVATIAGPGVSVTARFEQVPTSHDGSSEFRFQLHFSENVRLNHTDFSGALFETAGGTVTGARRLDPPSNTGWEVVARPDGDGNMIITLPAGRDCNTDGAVCAPDGSWLASTITTTIAGPGPTVTAQFEQVPSNHDGSSEFRFQLHFSEEVDLSATDFTGALFITAGGTVISATPLQPPSTVGWEVVARPDGTDDMVITLPEGRGCNTDGAVCAPDGSWLASTVVATIAGPAGVPVTARFEQVPTSHDGSSEFRFQLHFSEKVRLNHTDFSGALFETAGGTVTGARRLDPPSNIGWEVVARPDGDGNMVITLPAGRDCNTDGAVCAPDGSWLAVTISTTIAGPAGVP